MLYYCFRNGRRFGTIKTFNPLKMFASVLSQKSDEQQLSSVYKVHTRFSFSYRLDRWFSRLNGFKIT